MEFTGERRFEERGRPRVQPGYAAVPAFAGVAAVAVGALALTTGSPGVVLLAAGLVFAAVWTGVPVALARTYTVVTDEAVHRGVSPAFLGEATSVPADRIAGCRVVEAPRSRPPTDDSGDPLPGFGGPRRTGWPAGSGRLPDSPGVVIETNDGGAPRFPAVVPGSGIAGVLAVGEGPPGFLPSDRPEELAAAIESIREGESGGDGARESDAGTEAEAETETTG